MSLVTYILLGLTVVVSLDLGVSSLELEAVPVSAKLPAGRSLTSSIYDGDDFIYIFGGRDDRELHWQVWRYSISNDTMQRLPDLPRASYAGTVTSDQEGNIYYIGGYRTAMTTNIFRFSPVNGSMTTIASTKYNYYWDAVKYNETSAYIFGGYYYPSGITHFNLDTRETTLVRDLEQYLYYIAVFTDGKGTAYIFGNPSGDTWGYHVVEKLDMFSLESTFGPANFPAFRMQKPLAVWDGRYGYLIGGFANATANISAGGIFRFDPETMGNEFVPVSQFPGHDDIIFTGASAVYVPKLGRIYMIGGRTTRYGTDTVEYLDSIWYMDLPPTEDPGTTEASTTSMTTIPTTVVTTTGTTPGIDPIPEGLEAVPLSAKLPVEKCDASAIYDGNDSIYIFGGKGATQMHSHIYKYSLSEDSIEEVGSLPRPAYSGTVTSDGEGNMYYIGGYRSEMETLIFRYVPSNGSVSTFAYTDRRDYEFDTVKVNDSSSFTIGGFVSGSRIMHLNTATRETSIIGNISISRRYQAAFTDGRGFAYIFGNAAFQTEPQPVEVLNLHTLESSIVGPATFPALVHTKPSAVWGGRHGWIIGGFGDLSGEGMYRFDPYSMTNDFVSVKNFPGLPDYPFTSTSAVYVPQLDRIYMFGGRSVVPFDNTYHDGIWYVQL